MLVRVSEKMRNENLSWRSWGNSVLLLSISSTFYARVFLYKILSQKPKLNYKKDVRTKKRSKKRWWNWHLHNTLRSLSVMLQLIFEIISFLIKDNFKRILYLSARNLTFFVQYLKNHRHTLTNKFLWTFLYIFSQLIRLFRQ